MITRIVKTSKGERRPEWSETGKFKIKVLITIISLGLFVLLLSSCKDDKDDHPGIVFGPEVKMGNGKAQSFIRLNEAGQPVSVGFKLSEKALENLPPAHDDPSHHEHAGNSFVLELPKEKNQTTYDHISVDWSPSGHEPAGVYDKPHFDMHFYMLTQAERVGIDVGSKMELLPDASFLPKNYISAPGEGVAQMGKHWVDFTSPELSGKPFKTTFVYGSFDGKVIFQEPMMTHEWLLSKPDTIMNVAQPTAFAKKGLYPNKYSVRFDSKTKEYFISLEDLQQRY